LYSVQLKKGWRYKQCLKGDSVDVWWKSNRATELSVDSVAVAPPSLLVSLSFVVFLLKQVYGPMSSVRGFCCFWLVWPFGPCLCRRRSVSVTPVIVHPLFAIRKMFVRDVVFAVRSRLTILAILSLCRGLRRDNGRLRVITVRVVEFAKLLPSE